MTNQLQMQPDFRETLPWSREEAKQRLRKAIQQDDLGNVADSAGWVLDYRVPPDDRRFWSPHLSVQLYEPTEESDQVSTHECIAYCRFSPRPEIWTMVMAIYMVASCCLFAACIYGFVQWMLKQTPWALVVIPASILVIAGLHTASLIGQGWSRDQMHSLRSHWDRTVEFAHQTRGT